MKKSSLKTGMIVEYRNKEKRLVLLDDFMRGDILVNKDTFILLQEFNEDLKSIYKSEYDIVKIYKRKNYQINFEDHNLELIFLRK